MEDNVYISKGKLTPSNAALCEKAVRILDDLGAELATPKEARASSVCDRDNEPARLNAGTTWRNKNE